MRKRIYTKPQRRYRTRWHKTYNRQHRYNKGKVNRRFTWTEMYLIWTKRLVGGRILTDVEIAKRLGRSLQSVQLKRCKMKKVEGMVFI